MDEILIGEKKYLSSKQAAKVTGYAKDYIGQLCREGRVPARLVGRSWYVLESAIHDHRFGEQKVEAEKVKEPEPVRHSTWEAPRYEAAPAEVIPTVINRLKDDEQKAEEAVADVSKHLQDSWREWFDRVGTPAPADSTRQQKPVEEPKIEEREVNVPVHAIYHPQYQPLPEELLPRRNARYEEEAQEEEYTEEVQRPARRKFGATFQLAGALLALFMASLAVIGSGYFDKYIFSSGQFGMVAGVSLYNR